MNIFIGNSNISTVYHSKSFRIQTIIREPNNHPNRIIVRKRSTRFRQRRKSDNIRDPINRELIGPE